MKKNIKWSLIISIVLILTVIFLVTFQLWKMGLFQDNKDTYHYEVIIEANESASYTIILPVPIVAAANSPNYGNATEIINDLEFTFGDGIFFLNDTVYGEGLTIKFNDSFKLSAHKEFVDPDVDTQMKYGFSDINLNDDYESPRYIYFNSSNGSDVKITFVCYSKSTDVHDSYYKWGIYERILENGWNSFEMLLEYSEE